MGSAPASRDATGRDFVQAGLDPVEVLQAQVIANPANTVLQWSMIEATLENAVDSSLPDQLAATVTHPVWSFDQSQILIPAGSRLFGNHSSDVSTGQGRILVGWTRIVTPDGQSVQMEAFGGDAQGRSGITGKVNSRFGMPLGSAALISLFGAAPAIAAAKVSDATTSDTAQNVADDLSGATSTAIDAYINLPPIISVAPSAAIIDHGVPLRAQVIATPIVEGGSAIALRRYSHRKIELDEVGLLHGRLVDLDGLRH